VLAGLSLAGCAGVPRPPLRELYRAVPGGPEQPPLVVIPGAFGSTLTSRATGREIWPGSKSKLLLSDYRDLEIPIDPETLEPIAADVMADGVFEHGVGKEFYGDLLDTLESVGGFRRRTPGEPIDAGQRNYYLYTYDWRLDNVTAVRGLHDLIERIRTDYGDPTLRVDLLCHSNGGLLARYYARYGTAPLPARGLPDATCEGSNAIRRLLLIGTPNLGTLQAVLSHVRGEEVGLKHIPQDVIATCPGVPQLMPHPAIPWLLDAYGRVVPRSAFDIETWRDLSWSIFDPDVRARAVSRHGGGAVGRRYFGLLEQFLANQLDRGRAFMEALAAPAPPADVAPYVFGADCAPTLARLVAERIHGRVFARERPDDIVVPVPQIDYEHLMYRPGDLVVTRTSLLGRCAPDEGMDCSSGEALRIEHSVFLCEEHRSLMANPSFQNNLLYTLFHA